MLTLIQQIILGAVQGITEWIPISSSAALSFILSNFYGMTDFHDLIVTSLFFHLGTFLAALIYFRKDIAELSRKLFRYKYSDEKNKRTIKFLVLSTIISGIIGIILLQALDYFASGIETSGKTISFFIGILLLFTGVIQLKSRREGLKKERELKASDGILLGLAQGLAVLPGISRSGITVSTLLLKKFDDTVALRLSFLMSLPIVLIGNIFLNLNDLVFSSTAIYGLLASFVFGISTIAILMKTSKKINFGWFAIAFAILMMLSVFV